MVYTYNDNGDLVIVIKDAKNIKGIEELVGKIIMGATDVNDEKVQVEKVPDAALLPEEVVISSDSEFKAVATDYRLGRYNGEEKAKVCQKLNTWCINKFGNIENKDLYVSALSEDEVNKFLNDYDTIIPKSFKDNAVSISETGTYDIFMMKGDLKDKKKIIHDVLSQPLYDHKGMNA